MKRKKGYALLLVMCIAVLISAILLGILTLSLGAKKSTKTLEDVNKLSSIAESGVEKGMTCLRQKISTTANIFSDTDLSKVSLGCDTFSFNDEFETISCKVTITDKSSGTYYYVEIDSTATDNYSKKTKEIIVDIDKGYVDNPYYSMIFSHAATVLDDVYNNDHTPNTNVSFDMGHYTDEDNIMHGLYDITLDGPLYMQGGIINFLPNSTPETNQNDVQHENYIDEGKGSLYYYLTNYHDNSSFMEYPYHDTKAVTYISGTLKVNCNIFNYPTDTKAATTQIFNNKVTFANTIASHSDNPNKIGDLPAVEYPMLSINRPDSDSDFKNYHDDYYVAVLSSNLDNLCSFGTADDATKTDIKNKILQDMQYYDIYYRPTKNNDTLMVYVVKPKEGITSPPAFDFQSFAYASEDYAIKNINIIAVKGGTDKEGYYKRMFETYLIDGDVNISKYKCYDAFNGKIIYCTGTMNISSKDNDDSIIFMNCSLTAKKMFISNVKNREPVVSTTTVKVKGSNVYWYEQPFVKAVTLHCIKPVDDKDDVDGLNPFRHNNKNIVNSVLVKHLNGYGGYITFKIDKWVEK